MVGSGTTVLLWISLRFENPMGVYTRSLWFVHAIDLYWNRLKKQVIRFLGTVQSAENPAVAMWSTVVS